MNFTQCFLCKKDMIVGYYWDDKWYCEHCYDNGPHCYYCAGFHEDNPCPKRVADAERFTQLGKQIYGNT